MFMGIKWMPIGGSDDRKAMMVGDFIQACPRISQRRLIAMANGLQGISHQI
jgi:hypothetical protein